MLYTIKEAAEVWTVKPATIRKWIWEQRIPVVRVGRCIRIAEETVERVEREGLTS
jgi:excisionase family DNA binding protein